jgi:hypothetical protein
VNLDLANYPPEDLLEAYLEKVGVGGALWAVAKRAVKHLPVNDAAPDDYAPSEIIHPDFASIPLKSNGTPNRSACIWTLLHQNRQRRIGVGVDGQVVYGLTGAEVAKALVNGGIPEPPHPQAIYVALQQLESGNRARKARWRNALTDQDYTYWSAIGRPNWAAGEPNE